MRVENVKGAVWTVDEIEFYKRRPQRLSNAGVYRGQRASPYADDISASIQVKPGFSFQPEVIGLTFLPPL